MGSGAEGCEGAAEEIRSCIMRVRMQKEKGLYMGYLCLLTMSVEEVIKIL